MIEITTEFGEIYMDKKKIEQINFLARKSKAEGLTDAEKLEQTALRREYRDAFKASLAAQLDNIDIVEPDGKITKIKPES